MRISGTRSFSVISALGGEAASSSHDLRALGNVGVGEGAVETTSREADRFFRSPETVGLHHGEVDETLRNINRVGRSEVGEGLSSTNEIVTTIEDRVRVHGVLFPLPDNSTVLLFTMATEPGVLATESVEDDLLETKRANRHELTVDTTISTSFTTSLGLSVGDLAGTDEFVGGAATVVVNRSVSAGSRFDHSVSDGTISLDSGRSGEHDVLESSNNFSSESRATELEGSVSFIPSDGEGTAGATKDETITLLVVVDDGDSVTFNSVSETSGVAEDSLGSSTRSEVDRGSARINKCALRVGRTVSLRSSRARLLTARTRGFILDKDTRRIRRAHERTDRVSAERSSSVVVSITHNLLTTLASTSVPFAAKVARATRLSLAITEFLVFTLASSSVGLASRVLATFSRILASAGVFFTGSRNRAEVEVAVRSGGTSEGVKEPSATNITSVSVVIPTTFRSVGTRLTVSEGSTFSSDGTNDVAVSAARASKSDSTVRPSRRIGVFTDVRLRARIVASTSRPATEDTEARVREARKGRRFTEERVGTSGFPVGELTRNGLATLNLRVTLPELSVGIVSPDPLTFSFSIITTNPTETKELSADSVGFIHVGDGSETTSSTEETARFTNRASSPPIDGTVRTSEEHNLLRIRSEDVARTKIPVDDTRSSRSSSRSEDNITKDSLNLLSSEARAATLLRNDTEFTLMSQVGMIGGIEAGSLYAENISVSRVTLFDADKDSLGSEVRTSTRERNRGEGVDVLLRHPSLSSDRFNVRFIDTVTSTFNSSEASNAGSGRNRNTFINEPEAVGRFSVTLSFTGERRAVNTSRARSLVALVLVPDARRRNNAVFSSLELRTVADRETTVLFFFELAITRLAVTNRFGENSTLASGDTFADRRARRPRRPGSVLTILGAEAATTVEEIPSTRRVHQAIVTSGSIARLDTTDTVSKDTGSLRVAISLRGSRITRRSTTRRTSRSVGPSALGSDAGIFSSIRAVLRSTRASGSIPRTLRIVVTSRRLVVRALLGEARLTADNTSRILSAVLEVGVAPRTADLTFTNSTVEGTDRSEATASSFSRNGVALLVAHILQPEARALVTAVFISDLLTVVDALAGASEPRAAVTFSLTRRLSGKVPARALALTSSNIPATAIRRSSSTSGLVSTSTSLGTASIVVVVPLAVRISTTSSSVSTIGSRTRASTDVAVAIPQADTTRASSLRTISRASSSTSRSRTSSIPDALVVGVTFAHGSILELTRSAAVLTVPDADIRERSSLDSRASSLISIRFTILLTFIVGPHAGRISKAGFFSRVLTIASSFTSVGGRVDAATNSVGTRSANKLLARFDTALLTTNGVNKFTVLVSGALVNVGRVLRILDGALDLAIISSPCADGVGSTFSLRASLRAGTNTGLVDTIPLTVVISVTSGFTVVEITTLLSTSTFEGPVTLSSLAVLLYTIHSASLFTLVVGLVVLAPARASGTVVGAERRGADLGDTSLIGAVPFTCGVESTSNIVSPLARSVNTLADSDIPAAARIRDTRGFISGEAESSTTRTILSEPLALRIVVTRFTNTIAEGASRHTRAVSFDLTFTVLLTVRLGEDFAGTAASLELADPLAVRVGSTRTRARDGTAGTDTFRTLAIPETVRVRFTLSSSGVGNRTSGLAGVVDLHTLAGLTTADSITRELVTSSSARTRSSIPLAARVGLTFRRTVLVSIRADRATRASGSVPVTSREFTAAILRLSGAVTNTVTVAVDSTSSSRGTGSLSRARVSTSVRRGVELTVRVASTRRSRGGNDLRTLGVTSHTFSIPAATRVSITAVLGRMSGRALHLALTSRSNFTDGRGFTSLRSGDGVTRSTASSSLAIPQALRISRATNLGGVAQFTRSCASRSALVELTETRTNTRTITVVRVTRFSARLLGSIPLARLLSKAVTFSGELRARLFASSSGVVPTALRITSAASAGIGSRVLDGAQSRASEVLLIPTTNKALSFALSLSGDLFALLDALLRLGIPNTVTVPSTSSSIFVLQTAAR